jgi:hypothetical protein
MRGGPPRETPGPGAGKVGAPAGPGHAVTGSRSWPWSAAGGPDLEETSDDGAQQPASGNRGGAPRTGAAAVRLTARRLRALVGDPQQTWYDVRVRLMMGWYRAVNRFSRRPVTGSADVAVSLTSFGHRLPLVFHAIESIAAGGARPRRLILWLDEESMASPLPANLRRLTRRGLEIRPCPDYGPHKKQYPYAATADPSGPPLVTADDDVMYPRRWLAGLVDALAQCPDVLTGYRAHEIAVVGDRLAPYGEWRPRRGTTASFAVLCTGVSGVIYPPALLAALREEGDAFLTAAPYADDIWVHAVAVRHGIRSRQLGEEQADFLAVAGTQRGTLNRRNVREGGNDLQMAASYGPVELARVVEDRRRGA